MPSPGITGISHVDLSVTDLEASVAWYTDLLGLVPLFGGRNDDRDYSVQYLVHVDTGLVLGFEQHDVNPGEPFDERRVGLDHLSFNVEDRAQLDAWERRLDELGVEHSGIDASDNWDVLVARDPDNIQLEFFLLNVDPSTLTG